MTKLAQEHCISLDSNAFPITSADIKAYKQEVPNWQVVEVEKVPRLTRTFEFKNFKQALDFTNSVGEIAEEQGHHPLITLTWGKVTVAWWTHDIKGLHKNDFIMAAKTDRLFR